MTRDELQDIGTRGLKRLEMTIVDDALRLVRVIPRGLPQYAHLLAEEGARQALLGDRDEITRQDVMGAFRSDSQSSTGV